jgi:predicted metalloprotease
MPPLRERVEDQIAKHFYAWSCLGLADSAKSLSGVVTACGRAGLENPAYYCPAEEAIYYAPVGVDEHHRRIGDFAPIVEMAHEWDHHLQSLLSLAPTPGNAFELQTDCIAGVYAPDARRQGLLDPGDLTEAVAMAVEARYPVGPPQDAPGAHAINHDRITAFMRDYLNGINSCALS